MKCRNNYFTKYAVCTATFTSNYQNEANCECQRNKKLIPTYFVQFRWLNKDQRWRTLGNMQEAERTSLLLCGVWSLKLHFILRNRNNEQEETDEEGWRSPSGIHHMKQILCRTKT